MTFYPLSENITFLLLHKSYEKFQDVKPFLLLNVILKYYCHHYQQRIVILEHVGFLST